MFDQVTQTSMSIPRRATKELRVRRPLEDKARTKMLEDQYLDKTDNYFQTVKEVFRSVEKEISQERENSNEKKSTLNTLNEDLIDARKNSMSRISAMPNVNMKISDFDLETEVAS